MTDIYIMRINAYNYNAPWCEGEAHPRMENAKVSARKALESNYQCYVTDHKLDGAEMILYENGNDDAYFIGVYVCFQEEELGLCTAEIYRVPLAHEES